MTRPADRSKKPLTSSASVAGIFNGSRKAAALNHLKRVDPHFYRATLAHHATLPAQLPLKRTRVQLFKSLASIVTSQQLGTVAADAIFARVKKACKGRLTSLSILKIREEKLRDTGLSGAKIKTLKAIAKAVENSSLDLLSLKNISETEAAEKLMRIWGLGPWSAQMFLMSALGREDVFSVGDLGLVRSIEAIYALPKGAPQKTLLAIAEKWSPHRTYASLLLWRTRDKK